jgi:hypothetical protein
LHRLLGKPLLRSFGFGSVSLAIVLPGAIGLFRDIDSRTPDVVS